MDPEGGSWLDVNMNIIKGLLPPPSLLPFSPLCPLTCLSGSPFLHVSISLLISVPLSPSLWIFLGLSLILFLPIHLFLSRCVPFSVKKEQFDLCGSVSSSLQDGSHMDKEDYRISSLVGDLVQDLSDHRVGWSQERVAMALFLGPLLGPLSPGSESKGCDIAIFLEVCPLLAAGRSCLFEIKEHSPKITSFAQHF